MEMFNCILSIPEENTICVFIHQFRYFGLYHKNDVPCGVQNELYRNPTELELSRKIDALC